MNPKKSAIGRGGHPGASVSKTRAPRVRAHQKTRVTNILGLTY